MQVVDSVDVNLPFRVTNVEEPEPILLKFVQALARHHAAIDHDEELGAKGRGHGETIH